MVRVQQSPEGTVENVRSVSQRLYTKAKALGYFQSFLLDEASVTLAYRLKYFKPDVEDLRQRGLDRE